MNRRGIFSAIAGMLGGSSLKASTPPETPSLTAADIETLSIIASERREQDRRKRLEQEICRRGLRLVDQIAVERGVKYAKSCTWRMGRRFWEKGIWSFYLDLTFIGLKTEIDTNSEVCALIGPEGNVLGHITLPEGCL